ncbi:MAG: DNA-binding protein [Marinilabiliales bacterium]|nr:MAG: DNA-binding protein [Marinilabiliales bacterium]
MKELGNMDRKNHVYSRVIKTNYRTYFLDVRVTKRGQNYITLTESKKKFDQSSGKMTYEKHKVFLYKEDFDEFAEAFTDVVKYAKENENEITDYQETTSTNNTEETPLEKTTTVDLNFEDLGKEE